MFAVLLTMDVDENQFGFDGRLRGISKLDFYL